MTDSNWKGSLIGGSSGTGKTRLAQEFSKDIAVSVLQVDDLSLSLQVSTTDATRPALHRFIETASIETLSSPESGLNGYMAVAKEMEPAIRRSCRTTLMSPIQGRSFLKATGYFRGSDRSNILNGQTLGFSGPHLTQ